MMNEAQALAMMDKFPAISDLKEKARKRIPFVSWQYVEPGTGFSQAMDRNRTALDQVLITPRFIKGTLNINLETTFLGKKYAAPFGIAPMGLCGLVWPKTENFLAASAKEQKIPYCLSTVATQTPETIGPLVGDMGWFQLYPPKEPEILKDILKRAESSGFHTLLVTADVPAPSRREDSRKAGLTIPPKKSLRSVWGALTHPAWARATLSNGLPRLKTVEHYSEAKDMANAAKFARFNFRGDMDWEYIRRVRDLWKGPILIKGLMHPEDAVQSVEVGVEGIVVSNHGGRQFDGAPAAISVLPEISAAVGNKASVIFDSGIRTGLDIIRALALGADFVLIGRPYLYGVAALGRHGAEHVTRIFLEDLTNNMHQLGINTIAEAKELLPHGNE